MYYKIQLFAAGKKLILIFLKQLVFDVKEADLNENLKIGLAR